MYAPRRPMAWEGPLDDIAQVALRRAVHEVASATPRSAPAASTPFNGTGESHDPGVPVLVSGHRWRRLGHPTPRRRCRRQHESSGWSPDGTIPVDEPAPKGASTSSMNCCRSWPRSGLRCATPMSGANTWKRRSPPSREMSHDAKIRLPVRPPVRHTRRCGVVVPRTSLDDRTPVRETSNCPAARITSPV